MVVNHDEKISALVDGELQREEVDPLFDQLKRDQTSQACWRHYYLISDALKNNLPDKLSEDFVRRVSQALEAEPFLASAPRLPLKHSSFYKPIIGFALAASVAAAAFVGLGWINQIPVEPSPSLAMNVTPITTSTNPENSYSMVHGGQWDEKQPAMISKLNGYLLSHDQFSSGTVIRNGIMPQARIVVYELPESIQQDAVLIDNGR